MSQYRQPDDLSAFAEMLRRGDGANGTGGRGADDPGGPGGPRREPADPETRRRRRRRGRVIGLIATLVVIALITGYVFLTLTAPVGAAAAAVKRPDATAPAAVAYALPTVGEAAISVAGADDYLGAPDGGILASSGGNGALPIASISKLITAMVILSAKPLGASGNGPTLTFDKTDHALYDKYYLLNATIAAMPTGSTMSERDALETMLVVSACNYAEAVSTWAFGSQPAFLSATKKWLAAHGMTGTRMVEPTGLDDRNSSTPSDLVALGKLAMADPAIASIVAMTHLDVPTLPAMPSTNDLLGSDGVNGIKTGTLDTAGSDLLFSAQVPVDGLAQPLTMIGVVLGGQSRSSVDGDVRALINSISGGFHRVAVAEADQVVGTYSTPWGASAKLVLKDAARVFTWSNTPIASTMTTTPLKTGADGETVGSVTWTAGTSTATVPLVLQGTITPPSSSWRLTHPQNLLSWWPGYSAVGGRG